VRVFTLKEIEEMIAEAVDRAIAAKLSGQWQKAEEEKPAMS